MVANFILPLILQTLASVSQRRGAGFIRAVGMTPDARGAQNPSDRISHEVDPSSFLGIDANEHFAKVGVEELLTEGGVVGESLIG